MADWFARYRSYLLMLFLFVLVLAGTVYILRRPDPTALTITTPTPKPTPTIASLVVDVRGAVSNPGVYTLPAGSRVQDALALAGDVLANADTRTLNLARKLNDGEQIYVPAQGEPTPILPASSSRSSSARTPTAAMPTGKININTATLAELDMLPGVGAAIAQRIIDYRTQNGDFKKLDDLKKVRGIGDALFNQIKDLITIE
jgi:competence protein ComEA